MLRGTAVVAAFKNSARLWFGIIIIATIAAKINS